MGCTPSKYLNVYTNYKFLTKFKREFDVLCLAEADIGKLLQIFQRVDVDGSGNIELAELLVHLDVQRTPFTKRIFSLFDEDGSGEIDFREFVLSVWNYCSLGKNTLILFAFDIYDRDSSGNISAAEVQNMLRDVYGKGNVEKNQHARAISAELSMMEEIGGDIDTDKFRVFVKTHPALLFPAFLMQESIQKACMGVEFWRFHSEKRMELSKGQYISIGKFMELHLNKDLKSALVGSGAISNRAVKLLATTGSASARNRAAGALEVQDADESKFDSTVKAKPSLVNFGAVASQEGNGLGLIVGSEKLPRGRRFSIAASSPTVSGVSVRGNKGTDATLDALTQSVAGYSETKNDGDGGKKTVGKISLAAKIHGRGDGGGEVKNVAGQSQGRSIRNSFDGTLIQRPGVAKESIKAIANDYKFYGTNDLDIAKPIQQSSSIGSGSSKNDSNETHLKFQM